jgi:hypothetical protein
VFFLKTFAGQDRWIQAEKLFHMWPAIAKTARKAKKGAGYLVQLNGKMTRLNPETGEEQG